jgi:uncharacterized protein YceK
MHKTLLVMMLFVPTIGCGTMENLRNSRDPDHGQVYGGVRRDMAMMRGDVAITQHTGDPQSAAVAGRVNHMLEALAGVDLVFSVAFDTVTLPYTVWTAAKPDPTQDNKPTKNGKGKPSNGVVLKEAGPTGGPVPKDDPSVGPQLVKETVPTTDPTPINAPMPRELTSPPVVKEAAPPAKESQPVSLPAPRKVPSYLPDAKDVSNNRAPSTRNGVETVSMRVTTELTVEEKRREVGRIIASAVAEEEKAVALRRFFKVGASRGDVEQILGSFASETSSDKSGMIRTMYGWADQPGVTITYNPDGSVCLVEYRANRVITVHSEGDADLPKRTRAKPGSEPNE